MMTLKRLMEYRSNGLESTFLMILRTVSDRKEYLVKTLYEDIGWGGSEYESIFFPKNEVYYRFCTIHSSDIGEKYVVELQDELFLWTSSAHS